MIQRYLHETILQQLSYFPAVGLLGPRQVGKKTPPLLIVTPSADDYEVGENRFVCSLKTLKQNLDRYVM